MARQLPINEYIGALDELVRRATGAGYDTLPATRVSLGGCCKAIGTDRRGAMRRKAHAHCHPRDERRWWICVLSDKASRLVTATGRPTALFAHEYAHLLAPTANHGPKWQAAVKALGHPAEAKRYAERLATRHRHRWSAWKPARERQVTTPSEWRHCETCGMSQGRPIRERAA